MEKTKPDQEPSEPPLRHRNSDAVMEALSLSLALEEELTRLYVESQVRETAKKEERDIRASLEGLDSSFAGVCVERGVFESEIAKISNESWVLQEGPKEKHVMVEGLREEKALAERRLAALKKDNEKLREEKFWLEKSLKASQLQAFFQTNRFQKELGVKIKQVVEYSEENLRLKRGNAAKEVDMDSPDEEINGLNREVVSRAEEIALNREVVSGAEEIALNSEVVSRAEEIALNSEVVSRAEEIASNREVVSRAEEMALNKTRIGDLEVKLSEKDLKLKVKSDRLKVKSKALDQAQKMAKKLESDLDAQRLESKEKTERLIFWREKAKKAETDLELERAKFSVEKMRSTAFVEELNDHQIEALSNSTTRRSSLDIFLALMVIGIAFASIIYALIR